MPTRSTATDAVARGSRGWHHHDPLPRRRWQWRAVVVALSTQLALHMHRAQGSSVFPLGTLQGDVAIDFLSGSPGVHIAVDPNPPLQFVGGGTDSGWNIVDLRFAYDTATDTGYFGELTLHASMAF